jgi:hypothetical protein
VATMTRTLNSLLLLTVAFCLTFSLAFASDMKSKGTMMGDKSMEKHSEKVMQTEGKMMTDDSMKKEEMMMKDESMSKEKTMEMKEMEGMKEKKDKM